MQKMKMTICSVLMPSAEQRARVVGSCLCAVGVEDDRDQAHIVALGRSDQAITGLSGVAGLEAVHSGVGVEQGVAVALLDAVVFEIVFGVDGVVLGAVANDGARQYGEVTRGGLVLRIGQTRRVDALGVRHTKAVGLGVHQLGKAGL